MIMIQMTGMMGNQMFSYALYKALQQKGKDVCIEDFTHYEKDNLNCLKSVFHLSYKSAERMEYDRLTDSSMKLFHRVRRKLLGRKAHLYQEKEAIVFEPGVFDTDDVYMIGYFQSQKYFENVADQLHRDFRFDFVNFPDEVQNLRKKMLEGISVSVHIRRGDYMSEKFSKIYGDICTDAYYAGARRYLKDKYGNCTFYLFTDDPEWGKAQECEDTIYVDAAGPDSAYVDMALMSCCKHNIIANSSFSWWGAWLNENPGKEVIAPARWLNTSDGQDIYAGLCTIKVDEAGRIVYERNR